jgi:hypothetical protein
MFKSKKIKILRLLILLVVLSYLCNQYYSIYFRTDQHLGPIGLDDSDFYISKIAFFKQHWIPDGFARIPDIHKEFHGVLSAFVLGKTAVLMNISAEKMFLWNFFIGITLMGIVLFYFMSKFDEKYSLLITGFIFFSFFTGDGGSHGFFWVVPSFYCVMLWLLANTLFFYNRHWHIYGALILFLLFLSHPLGLYSIVSIAAALIIYMVLKQTNGLKVKINIKDLLAYNQVSNKDKTSYIITSTFIKKIIFISVITLFYYVIYTVLKNNKLIIPMQAEERLKGRLLSFFANADGFKSLWDATRFQTYFAGKFLLLILFGLYKCWKNKRFQLIAVFLSTLIGTLTFCTFTTIGGRRSFLLLHISLIFIISYGCKEAFLYFYNKWTRQDSEFLNDKTGVVTNGIICLLSLLFLLHLVYFQIGNDFIMRFWTQRYIANDELKQFLDKRNPDKVIVPGNSGQAVAALLAVDGSWGTDLLTPDMRVDFSKEIDKDSCFFGMNYRIYKTKSEIKDIRRKGIVVFWPKESSIVLSTGELLPGDYSVFMADTGIDDKVISEIELGFIKNNTYNSLSNSWKSEECVIKINKSYPFLLPWYAISAYYTHKVKTDFLTVRESVIYSLDFHLNEKTDVICLENSGNDKFILGNFKVFSNAGEKNIFFLDFDWGKTESVNNTKLFLNGGITPLLWQGSSYSTSYLIKAPSDYTDKEGNIFFMLDESFGDLKSFKPWSGSIQ